MYIVNPILSNFINEKFQDQDYTVKTKGIGMMCWTLEKL